MRTFHGYAMNGYADNVNGRDGEFQTFQLLESLPVSTNSYTFSLGSPSVTVELLGLIVWGLCQAEETSLAVLPHIQESWKNRPLPLERLT